MPSTLEALAVLLAAILPGGLYVWAFERQVGRWGVSLADRLLRFVATSAILHVAAAPLSYVLWRDELRDGFSGADPSLPLWLWPVAALYVGIPIALGALVGRGVTKESRLALALAGSSAAPTAWDHFFATEPTDWIRCRLKSGVWVGGAYAEGSYAGGHPEPADLYLVQTADVDAETGEFAKDAQGAPILRPTGLLVRWDEIEYLEHEPG